MNTIGRLVFALLLSIGYVGCATTTHSVAEVTLHLESGKVAAAQKQYDVALREYEWCWKGGSDNPECDGLRRNIVLKEFSALARIYPPALESLRELLHEAQLAMFRPPPGPPRNPAPFSVTGGYLGSAREAVDMNAARGAENPSVAARTLPADVREALPARDPDRNSAIASAPTTSDASPLQPRAADDAGAINEALWKLTLRPRAATKP